MCNNRIYKVGDELKVSIEVYSIVLQRSLMEHAILIDRSACARAREQNVVTRSIANKVNSGCKRGEEHAIVFESNSNQLYNVLTNVGRYNHLLRKRARVACGQEACDATNRP
jgi:hypothetical protein